MYQSENECEIDQNSLKWLFDRYIHRMSVYFPKFICDPHEIRQTIQFEKDALHFEKQKQQIMFTLVTRNISYLFMFIGPLNLFKISCSMPLNYFCFRLVFRITHIHTHTHRDISIFTYAVYTIFRVGLHTSAKRHTAVH